MPSILGANTLSSGSYDVANSLRFNSGSSESLTLSTTAGTRTTWTFSTWFKRSKLGVLQSILEHDDSNYFRVRITSGDVFEVFDSNTNKLWSWLPLLRDTSAWYHIVIRGDSTDGTNGNRVRLYINGSLAPTNAVASIDQNYTFSFNQGGTLQIGKRGSSDYLDGYLAETILIDGSALAPDQFGEFDDDTPTIWKPKNVGGLTFGTNGFYLDFEDSGNLGNDKNGGTDLSESNLAATDQHTDTCTNNFATMNPLDNYYNAATFSEGNLKITTATSGGYAPTVSNFGVSSGKWYVECKYVSRSHSDNYSMIGVRSTQTANTNYLGENTNDYAYYSGNGKTYSGGSASNYGNSYDQGETIGIYLDLDNNKLYFSKDGTLQNSGTGVSITAPGSTSLGNYFFSAMDYGNSVSNVYEWNFGGGTPTSISTGNADDNGYGNFEYSPNITGDGAAKSFYALNTKNIAEFG